MTSLLLVGCGKMGGALLARWRAHPPAGITQFEIIEPGEPHHRPSLDHLPAEFAPSVIVFAVKPQTLDQLLPSYAMRFGAKPLYLSIAAGKTLAFYRKHLGEHAHVVRAMPNTPATIGEGITALCAHSTAPASARHLATALMEAAGAVLWLENEDHMHAVTALSGSGPAYVFLFLDSLAKAGMALGLSEEVSCKLAIQTVLGSTRLAAQSPETFKALREQVTSPGGTTQAALSVLENSHMFESLIKSALDAAHKRSQELAQ